ncbi:hypothetical protein ACFSHR_05015 [Azotobacter chroococcum]
MTADNFTAAPATGKAYPHRTASGEPHARTTASVSLRRAQEAPARAAARSVPATSPANPTSPCPAAAA